MVSLLIGYGVIGFIWAVITTITLMAGFQSTAEAVVCFLCNFFFWPLIMILAVIARNIVKDIDEN